jgi:hypothetical protein
MKNVTGRMLEPSRLFPDTRRKKTIASPSMIWANTIFECQTRDGNTCDEKHRPV